MGKWKYLHWLAGIIILVFMYRHFSIRYEASLKIYVLSTAGWLIMTGLGYYIFMYKIRQTNHTAKKIIKAAELPKPAPRERPKVVLKKNQDSKK